MHNKASPKIRCHTPTLCHTLHLFTLSLQKNNELKSEEILKIRQKKFWVFLKFTRFEFHSSWVWQGQVGYSAQWNLSTEFSNHFKKTTFRWFQSVLESKIKEKSKSGITLEIYIFFKKNTHHNKFSALLRVAKQAGPIYSF